MSGYSKEKADNLINKYSEAAKEEREKEQLWRDSATLGKQGAYGRGEADKHEKEAQRLEQKVEALKELKNHWGDGDDD